MTLLLSDLAVVVALVGTAELAFRAGRAGRARREEALRTQIATVEAASLGLLALILGFTLSMVETRFNTRRQLVVAEAAAVMTAYFRAELLPDAGAHSRELLRDYAEARRAYFRATPEEAAATTARAREIHGAIWVEARAAARAHPDWDVLASYVASVNEVLALEEARDLAINARLPATIYTLLILIALVATGVTGYSFGLIGVRSALSLYILPLLIALAFAVILDLDRTRAGFLTTGDLPMSRVQQMMARDRAAAVTP